MNPSVIKVENVSKQYRLGVIGTGTFKSDLQRWWSGLVGKDDPTSKIGDFSNKKSVGDLVYALKDVSFDVMQGQIVGVIGKNGAGKSTLLKILSRTTLPSSGSVKIKGRIASLLEVGTGFHPELTGRQNVFLNGAILGMRRLEINSKFDEIVDFSGVEKYIDTPVKRYSSGMYVRLAFAVAAHLEPEILIVDEVLAVGDAEFQKKALGKMKSVSQGSGRTVLFVSHQLGSIRDICSHGIYLQNGSVAYQGLITETMDKYLTDLETRISLPISQRIDRVGNGNFKIVAIRLIRTDTNEETDTVLSGDNIAFEIDYEGLGTSTKVSDIHIGMPVFSMKGQYFLTALNNKMANYYFSNVSPTGTLRCEIERLPLMAGSFFLSVNFYVNKVLEDKFEEAFTFSVEPTDYYQSGTPSSFNREGIYVDQKWSHREFRKKIY